MSGHGFRESTQKRLSWLVHLKRVRGCWNSSVKNSTIDDEFIRISIRLNTSVGCYFL